MTDVDVEDDRGHKIPVINPLGLPTGRHARERLFRMWAGQTGTMHGYIWADSFESAFEEWVEYLDEHAPGHLVSHAEFVEHLDDAARDKGFKSWADAEAQWVAKHGKAAGWHSDMMEDYREIVEEAEADLTLIGHTSLKHGMYIASYEWGGDEIDDPGDAEFEKVWQASAEAYENQYDELPDPPDDVTPPKSQKRMKLKLDGVTPQRPKWTVPPRRK